MPLTVAVDFHLRLVFLALVRNHLTQVVAVVAALIKQRAVLLNGVVVVVVVQLTHPHFALAVVLFMAVLAVVAVEALQIAQ
jgi:hypothetical protein